MAIAQRIQEVIDDSGLSLPRFAKRLGVSRSTIINYKEGKTRPNTEFVEKCCEVYGLSTVWIVSGVGEKYLGKITESQLENLDVAVALKMSELDALISKEQDQEKKVRRMLSCLFPFLMHLSHDDDILLIKKLIDSWLDSMLSNHSNSG